LKNNLTKETLPQFLSYFSDNEKEMAAKIFTVACPEG
jgi:hypothetical protein